MQSIHAPVYAIRSYLKFPEAENLVLHKDILISKGLLYNTCTLSIFLQTVGSAYSALAFKSL
jgi:hypothetical protein